MKREEAIYRLKNTAWLGTDKDREETEQAVDMAIEALSEERLYTHEEAWGMTDLISRADAIEAVRKKLQGWGGYAFEDYRIGLYEAEEILEELPSADAEQVTGKLKNPCDSLLTDDSDECKEQKSKLESAEVAPKIDHDRDWIIGCIEHDGFIHTHRFDKANQIIHDALSADTVQGEWEHWGSPFSDESEVIDTIVCSVCGARFIEPKDEPKGEYNYCPNCGADMRGGDDE